MDTIFNDLEAGVSSNIPQNSNKKMRKRKQLDALVKFRSTKPTSNDVLQSSEDELFLPYQKSSIIKSRSSSNRRCWKYSQHIFSFIFICIFIIICVGLTYANIELKNEVQSLSSRINEIEEKFSNLELKDILSRIEQIKVRMNFLEHWNFSLIYDQLQKMHFQKLSEETKIETDWYDQLNSLRNQIQNLNQSSQIQELVTRFEQLKNSSEKTSVILKEFQSDLDKLRSQIDQCKCSKDNANDVGNIVNEG